MATVGVLLDDLFEDVEYIKPVAALKRNGHKTVTLGLKRGSVKGKHGQMVLVDKKIQDSSTAEFDAILIPGGYSPDRLRGNKNAVEFVKEFIKSGRPVFVICHGPQLLITADVLRGRRVTGWKSIKQDIINAGADYINSEVVVDGNLVSSRQPSDIPAFTDAILKKLEES